MANNPADAIVDRLRDRARDGFDAIGAELVERFREVVGVPVEGSGSKAIRSKDGEAPRRETGSYQDTFRHVTEVEGDVVRTRAGTDDPRGEWFTKGTATMGQRPHAERVREEFAGTAVERVKQALAQTKTQE